MHELYIFTLFHFYSGRNRLFSSVGGGSRGVVKMCYKGNRRRFEENIDIYIKSCRILYIYMKKTLGFNIFILMLEGAARPHPVSTLLMKNMDSNVSWGFKTKISENKAIFQLSFYKMLNMLRKERNILKRSISCTKTPLFKVCSL